MEYPSVGDSLYITQEWVDNNPNLWADPGWYRVTQSIPNEKVTVDNKGISEDNLSEIKWKISSEGFSLYEISYEDEEL